MGLTELRRSIPNPFGFNRGLRNRFRFSRMPSAATSICIDFRCMQGAALGTWKPSVSIYIHSIIFKLHEIQHSAMFFWVDDKKSIHRIAPDLSRQSGESSVQRLSLGQRPCSRNILFHRVFAIRFTINSYIGSRTDYFTRYTAFACRLYGLHLSRKFHLVITRRFFGGAGALLMALTPISSVSLGPS
jgi:hypothetical protein